MFPFLSPQCVVSFVFLVSFCCVVCHVLCDLCLFVCLWNFISVVFSVCHPIFLACQSLTKKWQAKWQHQRREVSRSTVGWQRHTQMQHSWCAKLRRRATRALRCLPLPACNLILEHARRKYMQILPLPAFLLLLPAITCTLAVSAIYRGHRCLTSKTCFALVVGGRAFRSGTQEILPPLRTLTYMAHRTLNLPRQRSQATWQRQGFSHRERKNK